MWKSALTAAVLLLACCLNAGADPGDFAGLVKTLSGTASIIRNGETLTASEGMKIMVGDRVRTGNQGAVGLIFTDDTVISMGPRTEILVDKYLFQPAEGNLSFIARILKCTLSFLSGQIAKLAPDSVSLMTPSATIGVRGTMY